MNGHANEMLMSRVTPPGPLPPPPFFPPSVGAEPELGGALLWVSLSTSMTLATEDQDHHHPPTTVTLCGCRELSLSVLSHLSHLHPGPQAWPQLPCCAVLQNLAPDAHPITLPHRSSISDGQELSLWAGPPCPLTAPRSGVTGETSPTSPKRLWLGE